MEGDEHHKSSRTKKRRDGDKTAGGKERTAVKNQSFKCVCLCDISATLTAVWLGIRRLKRNKDGENVSRCEIFNSIQQASLV